ncbi:MAG: xanthine dehydrogenase family protein subunit M [Pseudomonadota bacterium]
MHQTTYHKASSAEDAAAKLGSAEDGMILAGGQTLLPTMKQRLAAPSDLVDLSGAGLSGISVDGNTLTIGAMTTHAEVASSADVQRVIPSLACLAAGIGDPAVRNRGTIGGSVANNDPAADYPAAMLGLGATIVTNSREIVAEDFFTGMFSTDLEEGEVITSVKVTAPERSAYAKFPNPASRYAMAGVFVAKSAGGVRVAVTGAGDDGVFRHEGLETALASDFSAGAVDAVPVSADSMLHDIHGDGAYRAQLVKVMAKRAVEAA